MYTNRKVEKNVMSFLSKSSDLVGKFQSDLFSQEMYCAIFEYGLASPIEDLFYIAFNAMAHSALEDINPNPEYNQKENKIIPARGIYILPQARIGKFRVDFLIYQNGIAPENYEVPVVVELDGHDFHDKDKTQRAYEKSRDRFLVKSGYKVLHFTGSEVVKDPYFVAYEALSMIGAYGYDPLPYDKRNPLGVE
jgi:very-short-patch-repair endonuclease